jgi:hypothetical protein
MKLKTLDKRNLGYSTWKYYIKFNIPAEQVTFCNIREWCWSNWGASKELGSYDQNDLFDGVNCSNHRWCWQHDEHRTRIYLLGDEELLAFSLKWF